jgi:hypothetical protein
MSPSIHILGPAENELPSGRGAVLVPKASRLLLVVLCASYIAYFPVAMACRLFAHFFP